MKPLQEKVAVVAGASRGAGRDIALALGEAGHYRDGGYFSLVLTNIGNHGNMPQRLPSAHVAFNPRS